MVSVLSCLAVACDSGDGTETTGAAGGAGGAGGEASFGPPCPDERADAIGAVDKVSEGEVTVLSDEGGTKTLYVDASAGGTVEQTNNPWVYLNLGSASRVDITDVQADTSMEWDLAMKRPVIRTNSGHGGPGGGGALFLKEMAFEAVTKESAGAPSAIPVEDWFDESCMVMKDPGGFTRTTFDAWYDYGGEQTHAVEPHPGVFIVRGAKGGLFKLELQSYYSNPDGSDGMAGGRFKLRFAAL
jgi:hypothetical protein